VTDSRRVTDSRGVTDSRPATDSVRRTRPRPDLDGVLVVDKPAGPTSHDVVALVRRLTGVRRVGHGGTLDPFAAGVLPVFVGRATRLVEYHLGDEKSYRAVVAFGARSTTDDLEGEFTPGEASRVGREQVEAALEAFRGPIEQVPPSFSAVKIGGRKAYELARHGATPELRPRHVEIRQLDLEAWEETGERPTATLFVRCTAGTYVRSLARDLGEHLGSGAYLAALTRTASGPFRVEDAHPLAVVQARLGEGRAGALLLPVDAGLDAYPRVTLPAAELAALAQGKVVRPAASGGLRGGPDDLLRVVDEQGRLAAMARLEGGRLHPEKVLLGPAA
jgi:tRNA pseudouridine55 synthase